MVAFFDNLMDGQYAPHGYCLLWQPELLWTHIISDVLIAGAYFSIPLALIHFIRRRRDLEFGWILSLFAAFIMACGTTHLMSIWTLWNADYGIEAIIKAFTAIVSVGTAIALWRLIPRALAIPSPTQLRTANAELAARIAERDIAMVRLREEIEQREKAEAALLQAQKIEAVGQLTGGLAHDFNNLLQVVSGNLEMIARRPDDSERVQRLAGNALQAAERGTRLTGQLLAFSRTQRLALKPIDVRALIEGMLELLVRTLGPAIRVETRLPEMRDLVMADETQLELAVLNLAINARDAMPDGGTLTIGVAPRLSRAGDDLEPGHYLDLSIADTGSGMAEEVARRAFEPFFTTKDVGKGTGLGLSMVYGVAKQSGGKAEITSTPGTGTTVTIALRTIAVPGDTPRRPDQPLRTMPTEMRTGVCIMVVDDDPEVRSVMCEILGDAGHDVIDFGDGEAALAALGQANPDLLVVDFAMPGMNGAEVARRACLIRPGLPVLFVSGFADTAAIEAAVGEDAPMLRKPFVSHDLQAMVTAVLE